MLCPPSLPPCRLNGILFSPGHQTKTETGTGLPSQLHSQLRVGKMRREARGGRQRGSQSVTYHTHSGHRYQARHPSVPPPAGENRFCNGLPPPATTSKATSQSPSSQFSNARREMYLELLHTAAHRRALTDSLVNNYKYHRDLSNRMSSSKKSTR